MESRIKFHKPPVTGLELQYISQALASGTTRGDGPFTLRCQEWMEEHFKCSKVFLTHSCTASLEMAGLLCGLEAGDEVILPTYTFVSTANAFMLRGARPVFVDIRRDTLNIDENAVQNVITDKSKIICPVHYGGVGCEMDFITKLSRKHNLMVVEDAAQGVMASYGGRALGTLGDLGAYSFHETKSFGSGEGGAILINNPDLVSKAEIIREKGTNRKDFLMGKVRQYSWVELGSSYLPSDIMGAYLFAQLESAEKIKSKCLDLWNGYYAELKPLEDRGDIHLPTIPENCDHNAHLFYLLLESPEKREKFLEFLNARGIESAFHFVPLHLSPMGKKLGYGPGDFPIAEETASTIARLPLYYDLSPPELARVIAAVREFFM